MGFVPSGESVFGDESETNTEQKIKQKMYVVVLQYAAIPRFHSLFFSLTSNRVFLALYSTADWPQFCYT